MSRIDSQKTKLNIVHSAIHTSRAERADLHRETREIHSWIAQEPLQFGYSPSKTLIS